MINETLIQPPSITSSDIYIKNNLLDLASVLNDVLSRKGGPLRTIIIVPNDKTVDFLTQYLTDSSGAFFGARFLTLEQAIQYFIKISYSETFSFPSIADLSLHIESLIINPQEKLLPLLTYLGNDKNKISSLSQELAPIFLYYGIYGGKALDDWENIEDWQQILWLEIQKHWNFPSQILKKAALPKISHNLILFNLHHIPPLYKNFIAMLSKDFQTSCFYKLQGDLTSIKRDNFLQIHVASSPLREIEILLDNLKLVLERDSIHPEEVIVLASDLNLYFPFIQYIFEQESSPLGYSIGKLESLPYNHFLKTIDLFFSLVESRFEKESIVDLLFSEPITRRQNFTSVEFSILHQIIDEMNIDWGFDLEMRKEILEIDAISARGSWSFAFNQTLISLAYSSSFEISKFETLGTLISFLETLFTDLRSLKIREETLSSWIVILDELLQKYFPKNSELEFILNEIHSFGRVANITTHFFPFSSIHMLLKEILRKKTFERIFSKKPVIQFANLSDGCSIDAKAVFLLGMCEDSFPRKETRSSLNQLKKAPGSDHKVDNSEKDRFYFIESTRSAKEKLVISYVGLSEKDGKPLAPSLCVQELLHISSSIQIQNHPNIAFYPKDRKDFNFSVISLPEMPITVDIRHLIEALKHPIRFYANRVLGVFLDKAPEKDSREFFLSYIDKAQAIDSFQRKSNEELLEIWETRNVLPTALFQEQAKLELLNELKEVHLGLKTFSISSEDFFSIHFDPACKEPSFLDSKRYIQPAIQGTLPDGRPFTLIGKLPSLSKQGIYIHKEYSTSELWKHLPHLSILNNNQFPAPPILLFGKDLSKKLAPFPLTSLIEYYLEVTTSPSPLLPEQIDKLLKKKLFSPTSFFDDPYLTFLAPDLTKDWDKWLILFKEIL